MANNGQWQNRISGHGEEAPDQLLANPRNWRIHPKSQQDALGAVLREIGIVDTIMVNQRTGFVVDGHLRVAMAISERQKTIPVTYVDLNEDEEKLILASFDPIAAMAAADREQLGELLKGIESEDAAIRQMLESIAQENKIPFGITEGLTDDDEIPEEVETICKTGDLWQLGDHRLLCGDATKREDVERLMQGEKADMVFTDPPYGIDLETDYTSYHKPMPQQQPNYIRGRRYSKVKGDNIKFNPEFLLSYFRDTDEIFLWGADYYHHSLPDIGCFLVWDKSSDTAEGILGSAFELCWSKQKHKKEVARIFNKGVYSRHGEGEGKRVHPTQKPIRLSLWFFERWGKRANIITDLYGGSGTTLIACEKLGRRCRMMEIDEHYNDIIVQRWQNYTGKEAELIDGRRAD